VVAAIMTDLSVSPTDTRDKAFYTSIVTQIYAALAAADVSPIGTTPMSNSGGPVAGLGKIV